MLFNIDMYVMYVQRERASKRVRNERMDGRTDGRTDELLSELIDTVVLSYLDCFTSSPHIAIFNDRLEYSDEERRYCGRVRGKVAVYPSA